MSESSVVPVSAGVSAGVDGVSAAGDAGRVALSDTPDAILRRVPVAWLDAGSEGSGSVSCSCSSGISPATLALVGVGVRPPELIDGLRGFPGVASPASERRPSALRAVDPVPLLFLDALGGGLPTSLVLLGGRWRTEADCLASDSSLSLSGLDWFFHCLSLRSARALSSCP